MAIKDIKIKGLAYAVSDYGIAEGQCLESVNVEISNNEIAPVYPPRQYDGIYQGGNYKLLYIHRVSDGVKYVGTLGNKFVQILDAGTDEIVALGNNEEVLSVQSVGNTIIVATSSRMFYALFKDGQYKYLGEQVPEADIDFSFTRQATTQTDNGTFDLNAFLDGYVGDNYDTGEDTTITSGIKTLFFQQGLSFNEIMIPGEQGFETSDIFVKWISRVCSGIASKMWGDFSLQRKRNTEHNMLTLPIFVRWAIRLYDGSHIRQSVPVLIDPDSFTKRNLLSSVTFTSTGKSIAMPYYKGYTLTGKIVGNNAYILEDWKDIIQGIDIYFSEEIYTTKYGAHIESISANGGYKTALFQQRSTDELESELLSKSNFYKVKEIAIDKIIEALDSYQDYNVEFDNIANILGDNLVVQQRLEDDYLSHHKHSASVIMEYNKRLNMSGIKQTIYDGASYPMSKIINSGTSYGTTTYRLVFYVKCNNNILRDYSECKLPSNVWYGNWLAYPDTRCYKAEVYYQSGTNWRRTVVDMKVHPLLNISYAFFGFTQFSIGQGGEDRFANGSLVYGFNDSDGELITHNDNSHIITDKLYQSEPGNPFLFKASGMHTVPTDIIGMATTSKALSQGQFGQFPLYVFGRDGIWAMEVNGTGGYSRTSPMSRDVCINPKSITNIDGAVVFVSKKGVMMIAGGEVSCISSAMDGVKEPNPAFVNEYAHTYWGSELPDDVEDGKSFIDYIQDAFISYDYGNDRIILINGTSQYQYMYSKKSGTWHKLCFDKTFVRAVNGYPDCLIQDDSGKTYNFSVLSDMNDYYDPEHRIFSLVITRGLSLDNPYVRKRMDDLRLRGNFERDHAKCLLYGSFDGVHYTLVKSLKGKSFKFFKIALFLHLLPKERLSAVTVSFTERWNNKLR